MPTSDRPNTRDGRGRYTRRADTARRDAEACELRTSGATYTAIATALGYTTRGDAYRGVQRALTATMAEPAAELRALEVNRLDELWRHAWPLLDAGDPDVVLKAVDRLLKVQERRARLLGLDAPSRIEAVTVDQVDAEIQRLAALLGAGGEPK